MNCFRSQSALPTRRRRLSVRRCLSEPRLAPIEETAEAMHTLHKEGKIRPIGARNVSIIHMEHCRRIAPIHVLQPHYNQFERDIEAEILPYCRKNEIATFGYGAL